MTMSIHPEEIEFKKSSFSGVSNCVEVGVEKTILVKDSKDPGGPVLKFTHSEWAAFKAGFLNGEFDLAALLGRCEN